MIFRKTHVLFLILVLTAGCAGSRILRPAMKMEEYQSLSWDKKIEYFNSLKEKSKNVIEKFKLPGAEIYASAFKDPIPAVVISALDSIDKKHTTAFKPQFYKLLLHKNPVVRWKACLQITSDPAAEDLPYFSIIFSDLDWMVKECAFGQIRLYREEKNKKSYFFTIVSHLDEKNPQVLKEIYQTLKWYDDVRTYPYMYKRMFLTTDSSELIIIMREMAAYKNYEVKQRLWYLSQKHRDFFVREEASNLLKEM